MRGRIAIFAVLALGVGCSDDKAPPAPRGSFDGGPTCTGVDSRPPSVAGDVDGDGTPNDSDPDADGDGIDNGTEQVGGFACAGADVDGDGTPNWLDRDSDDDGLFDQNELGSADPYDPDTDDDGWGDAIEIGVGSRAEEPSSVPRGITWAGELPRGGSERIEIDFVNRIESADVFFLVDTTGTMDGERDNLVMGLTDIVVPGIRDAIPDAWFGAAGFEDYPISPYGGDAAGDRPFYLLTSMIPAEQDLSTPGTGSAALMEGANEVPDILDAIDALRIRNGEDLPEAFVPALYATATGDGLPWPGGMVPPQSSCAPGRHGYPCFREEALPIVVLVGDAPFHNGPDMAEIYGSIPDAPTYDGAVAALDEIGARVVGIYSGDPMELAASHFRRIATDTRTLDADGSPMVFQIADDGTGLSTSVVMGVASLAEGRTQDVSARASGGGSYPSGIDPLAVVSSLETGEATTYASKDTTTFYGLAAGSDFHYFLSLTGTVEPSDEAQVLVVRIGAIDQDGATFATRRVIAVVPPEGRDLMLVTP